MWRCGNSGRDDGDREEDVACSLHCEVVVIKRRGRVNYDSKIMTFVVVTTHGTDKMKMTAESFSFTPPPKNNR